jgi:hypothetical protein
VQWFCGEETAARDKGDVVALGLRREVGESNDHSHFRDLKRPSARCQRLSIEKSTVRERGLASRIDWARINSADPIEQRINASTAH